MHSSRTTFALTLLVVATAALALLAPFFFLGNASGHDFEFHLASWMDVVHQWHQRVLYPRWAELANYGYGEPRFIFYPPLSWMLGAALSLAIPWPMVPGAFYFVTMLLAGACMFRLAREWLSSSDAALAALLYAVNPYHQLHIYWRSDFAEILASAIFPLVVLYSIRTGQGDRRSVLPLSLLVAACWLMNAPAAVVATYTVALLVGITVLQRRSPRGILPACGALLLGFALAAFYILPAWYEQSWVNIAEALSPGLKPVENFLFTWTNDPEHTYFNFLVSRVAIAEMLVALLVLLAARKLRKTDGWWPLVVLLAVSAVLMFRVSLPAWRYLPELRFVQFPWRWLFAFNAVLAVLLAAAFSGRRRVLLWGASVAALALCAILLTRHSWWDPDGVTDQFQAVLAQGKGYEGTDEYSPLGCDHYDLDLAASRVAAQPAQGTRIHIARWRAEHKDFTVRADQPVTVALRLLNYPAWSVTVNGRPAQAGSHEGTGQMLIPLPAGTSRVELAFVRTADRFWGGAISLAAVAAWLLLALMARSGRLDTTGASADLRLPQALRHNA